MNGTDLTMFTNLDGTLERYYALGDRFLHKAFDLLTAYGNSIANNGLNMTLGGLDFYLPKQLQNMQHHAAVEMEKRLGDYVWNHLKSLIYCTRCDALTLTLNALITELWR
jgi:hypothetical protein